MMDISSFFTELTNLFTFSYLGIALIVYWVYSIFAAFFQGVPLFTAKSARNYFIAGRSLPGWMFIAAATATSFSGWTFISHPGVIYEYGFPAAYASFYAITIPLAGVFFLKRQWLLGQRCGFVTPGEMFYAYFKSDTLRYLVVVVAVLFSLFYLAVQLRASGYLFSILTDGQVSIDNSIVILSVILIIYVTIGGLRTVAYIDTMQALLLASGIVTLGIIVSYYSGGLEGFSQGIERLANFHQYFHDSAKHFVIPSLFDWDKQSALENSGSYWTTTFIFTFLFALMGIQSSPAFTMWAFATKDVNAFGWQQVWASSLIIGFIMIIFTAIIGIGGHFLGADYSLRENSSDIARKNILGIFINDEDLLIDKGVGKEALVPLLIRMTLEISPFLIAILAVAALAAIQSTAASYMSTVGSMLSRDLLKNGWGSQEIKDSNKRKTLFIFSFVIIAIVAMASLLPDVILIIIALSLLIPIIFASVVYHITGNFGERSQKLAAVVFTIIITLSAGRLAMVSTETLVFMGALAVAYGVQMMPALIAICWQPFFTAQAIKIGLVTGLITVTLTEFPILPWGQWPLTIHSAAWGFIFNMLVVLTISFFQQKHDNDRTHRNKFHNFLNDPFLEHKKDKNNKINWYFILTIVLVWSAFAIGAFAILGNFLFGDSTDRNTWWFGIPPIWAWQILWWVVGVIMMWFLAFKIGLSTLPQQPGQKIKPLQKDISESSNKFCENIYPSSEK